MKRIFFAAIAGLFAANAAQATTFTFVTALPSAGIASGVQNGVDEGALGPVTANTIANGLVPAFTPNLNLPTNPFSQTLALANGSNTSVTSSLGTGLTQSTAESRLADQNVTLSLGAVDILLQNTGSQRITVAPNALRFEADGTFARSVGPDVGQNLGAAANAFTTSLQILGGDLLNPVAGRIFSESVLGSGQVVETNGNGVQLVPPGPGQPANGAGTTFDDAGFDSVLSSAGFFVDPGEFLFVSGLVTSAAGSTSGSSAFTDGSNTGALVFDLPSGVTIAGAPTGFFLSGATPPPPPPPTPIPAPVPLPAAAWLMLSAFGFLGAFRRRQGEAV